MPAITFIMPMYNAEAFLREALDSVMNQSLADIELICIDDGSIDDTLSIVASYAKCDPRIKILRQGHRGVCAARNAGIDAATGEFLCFYDSDDFLYNDRFAQSLYDAATRNGQLVAGAPLYNFRAPDKFETHFDHPYYRDYVFDTSAIVNYSQFQFDYGFTRHIYSRKLFEGGRNRFGGLRFFEDTTWMVRILDEAGSFATITNSAYIYRCDYRPISWDTQKIIDLLHGAKENLGFSKDRGYAKLHWFTVHHLDEASHYTGVGMLAEINVSALEGPLQEVEQAIDHDLLAMIDPSDIAYTPLMRKMITSSRTTPSIAKPFAAAAFRAKRAVTPLYHRLTR